jgi:uncharacterized membrane protein
MTHPSGEQRIGYERTVAFSDGVFAIAITLLVLAIEVPDVPEARLGDALGALGDDVLMYFIGFAVMGLFWAGHHRFFAKVQVFDTRLVSLNLVYLSLIALMPFTTGLLGEYADAALAVTMYAANVAGAALAEMAMTGLALRERLLVVDPARARALVISGLIVPAVFCLSIPIAYLDADTAKWSWLALVVLPRVLRRVGIL